MALNETFYFNVCVNIAILIFDIANMFMLTCCKETQSYYSQGQSVELSGSEFELYVIDTIGRKGKHF